MSGKKIIWLVIMLQETIEPLTISSLKGCLLLDFAFREYINSFFSLTNLNMLILSEISLLCLSSPSGPSSINQTEDFSLGCL